MLPSFDTLKIARNAEALEDAFERLVDIADRRFMRGNIIPAEYDAWYQAATSIVNDRLMEEFRPAQTLQSHSDFIEG